jgi:hypothetical protein
MLDLEQRPFALRADDPIPDLIQVEDCELVEALVSMARLLARFDDAGQRHLVELEARNFGRALRAELRQHHESVVAVVRDELDVPIDYSVTEKGRRFQEARELAEVPDDEADRLEQHRESGSAFADETIELVLGSALDAGETYRGDGGRLLYRGPCAGGCGKPVNGVSAQGRYAKRHAECRS